MATSKFRALIRRINPLNCKAVRLALFGAALS